MKTAAKILNIFSAAVALTLAFSNPAFSETGELSLQDAIDIALKQSPELFVADSKVNETRMARDEAYSNFLPDVNFVAQYTYNSNVPEIEVDISVPVPGFEPPTIQMGYHDNYLLAIKADQVLYSQRVIHAYRAVEEYVRAGELQAQAARVTIARFTAEAYWGVLIAEDSLEVQNQALETAREHLDRANKRYRLGAAPRLDVVRAEVDVDSIVQQVKEAERLVDNAYTMLKRAMGYEGGELELSEQLKTEPVEVDESEAIEKAYSTRKDLLAMEASRNALEEKARAVEGGRGPTVMLNASYSYQKPYFVVDEWEDNFQAGVGVTVPIYRGGELKKGAQKARAEAETTSYTIARTRADIFVDVHNAVTAMDEAASRVNLTTYNVERAETLVKIANDSYMAGGVTSLEVIDARLAATRARLAHLKACYDYRVARVRLAAAQGDIEGMWRE